MSVRHPAGNARHINLPIFIPELACPGRCIFCNQQSITGRHRAPGPVETAAIISEMLANAPDNADIEVAFFGGTFTALPLELQEAYLSAARTFIDSGRVRALRISTRPDYIDEIILEKLRMYGVATVELGVQSFSDAVLAASRRGYDSTTALRACRMVKKKGMALGVQLMIGLPEDSRERALESCRLSAECGADMARIYPTLVIAGTELAEMMQAGNYQPMELEEAMEYSAAMLLALESTGVEVIRIGLQSGQDLVPGQTVLAGPYHPAFGELVEQRIYYDLACEQLARMVQSGSKPERICLEIPQGHLSKMIGQHRWVVERLRSEYGLESISVREAQMPVTGGRAVLIVDG